MARREADREDLFLEARGLVKRIEFPLGETRVVCGLGKQGGLSLYLGPDEMYRFSVPGGLWRAYVGGELYRAELGRRLTRLCRQRKPDATVLLASELSESETNAFLARVAQRISWVHGELTRLAARGWGSETIRVAPAGAEQSVIAELCAAMAAIQARPPRVANGRGDR